jgi:hypothetical protein
MLVRRSLLSYNAIAGSARPASGMSNADPTCAVPVDRKSFERA